MPQDIANRDIGLPVGAELGPVLGDGLVIGQQAPIGQSVNHRRLHAFGRRESHCAGGSGPSLTAGPVRPSRPDVDDGAPFDVDAEGSSAEPTPRKQPREELDDVCEMRVGGAGNTARQAVVGYKQSCRCHCGTGPCAFAAAAAAAATPRCGAITTMKLSV